MLDDPQLWDALKAHGVLEAHLRLLLDVLRLHKNGSWAWHFAHGQLTQADLRLMIPGRPYEVERVRETLLDGNGLMR